MEPSRDTAGRRRRQLLARARDLEQRFGPDESRIVFDYGDGWKASLPSSYASVIVGFAWRITGFATTNTICTLLNGSTRVGAIQIIAGGGGGQIRILNAAGATVATGATVLATNTTYYIEIKLVVGTSGTAEIKLNGVVEIAAATGNFGTSNVNAIQLSNSNSNASTSLSGDFDDLYVLDTTGAAPRNDFLGDVVVRTLYPISDGSHTDWTPLSGTDHFAMVNERTMDGDGSYVYDSNAGDIDTYNMQAIGVDETVYAAQLNIAARKGDVGLRQIAPVVSQAGTDHVGDTITLSSDYVFYSQMMEQDPTGTDWTASTINGDEYGMKDIA